MKSFLAFLLAVAVFLLVLLNVHIVRTKTSILLLKKGSMAFKDTYADISMWKPSDLKEHEALLKALRAAGHGELIEAIEERGDKEEGRIVPPWAVPAPSPEAVRTATQTQTGSGATQKRIRDRIKEEVGK